MKVFHYSGGLVWLSLFLTATLASAADYYVSPTGQDAVQGAANMTATMDQPCLTISHAASLAKAGDTVWIRAGTYRLANQAATNSGMPILPHSGTANEPITFRPYNDEIVTINGASLLPSSLTWTTSTGPSGIKIYSEDVSASKPVTQVFLDGKELIEARWPRWTAADLSHPNKATVTSYANGVLSDTAFGKEGFADNAWQGAIVHFVPGMAWNAQDGTVTSSSGSNLIISIVDKRGYQHLRTGNQYYLTGKLLGLSAPGEWFYDSATKKLYVSTPDGGSPAAHDIEVLYGTTPYAFDLSGCGHVTIQNLNLFAATINSDAKTHDVVLDKITAQYLSESKFSADDNKNAYLNTGIVMKGTHMTLSNSTLAYSWGAGVNVAGQFNTVTNCTIHDVDYDAYSSESSICLSSGGHTITHNTIYNAGRDLIRLCLHAPGPTFLANKIEYNDLSNCGLQTADFGAYYGNPGMEKFEAGDEIAYNYVHDINCALSSPQPMPYPAQFGQGIYPDSNDSGSSHGFRIHNNCVWNCGGYGIIVNNREYDMQVYNNTVWDKKPGSIAVGKHTSDVTISNNAYNPEPMYGDNKVPILLSDSSIKFVATDNVRITNENISDFSNLIPGIYTNLQAPVFHLKSRTHLPSNVGAFPFGVAAWTAGVSPDATASAPSH